MMFCLRNDGGMELHIDDKERDLIFRSLQHHLFHAEQQKATDEIVLTKEIMKVLEN